MITCARRAGGASRRPRAARRHGVRLAADCYTAGRVSPTTIARSGRRPRTHRRAVVPRCCPPVCAGLAPGAGRRADRGWRAARTARAAGARRADGLAYHARRSAPCGRRRRPAVRLGRRLSVRHRPVRPWIRARQRAGAGRDDRRQRVARRRPEPEQLHGGLHAVLPTAARRARRDVPPRIPASCRPGRSGERFVEHGRRVVR